MYGQGLVLSDMSIF